MSINKNSFWAYVTLGALGIFGPILFPDYTLSIAYLWMMV
ncbi:MAG TPA: branched-chain amino acid ABC transporter permease, partial [Alphaproteobacteria bacterium]|nr:branched-chain amino acid ABC transporter permease [Alphaproteobacteria bacterium]